MDYKTLVKVTGILVQGLGWTGSYEQRWITSFRLLFLADLDANQWYYVRDTDGHVKVGDVT